MRLAFWLALLVLLLPTDGSQQARFTSFSNAALQRLSTFCDRNASTCEAGSQAWGVFLRKAEFGLRLVGDLLGAGGHQGPPQYGAPQYGSGAVPPAAPPGRRSYGKADPREPPPAPLPPDVYPPDPYQPPWRPRRPKEY